MQAVTGAFTPSGGGNQIQQHIQPPAQEDPDPPGGVSGLSATHNGGSVSVSWNAASGVTGYDVNYSTDGKYSWTRTSTNQSGTSYTLTGADSGKDYVFAVRAVNSGGSSGWANSPTAPTPPPSGVSSVSATHQSATSYTLSGADATKTYVFGVRAVNSGGSSGWTNSPSASAPSQ